MLPRAPDWRWLLKPAPIRPWYPTLRLFRQDASRNFRSVAEAVAAELPSVDWSRK